MRRHMSILFSFFQFFSWMIRRSCRHFREWNLIYTQIYDRAAVVAFPKIGFLVAQTKKHFTENKCCKHAILFTVNGIALEGKRVRRPKTTSWSREKTGGTKRLETTREEPARDRVVWKWNVFATLCTYLPYGGQGGPNLPIPVPCTPGSFPFHCGSRLFVSFPWISALFYSKLL